MQDTQSNKRNKQTTKRKTSIQLLPHVRANNVPRCPCCNSNHACICIFTKNYAYPMNTFAEHDICSLILVLSSVVYMMPFIIPYIVSYEPASYV